MYKKFLRVNSNKTNVRQECKVTISDTALKSALEKCYECGLQDSEKINLNKFCVPSFSIALTLLITLVTCESFVPVGSFDAKSLRIIFIVAFIVFLLFGVFCLIYLFANKTKKTTGNREKAVEDMYNKQNFRLNKDDIED